MPPGERRPTLRSYFLEPVRSRWDRLDLAGGARAALIFFVPLAVGYAFRSAEAAVLITFGALNLLLVTSPRPGKTRHTTLGLAVLVNAATFAAGALVSTTPPPVEVLLVGGAIFAALVTTLGTGREPVGLIGAVMFVVGVGLPGGDLTVAGPEFLLLVVGGLWGLVGYLIPLVPLGRTPAADPTEPPLRGEDLRTRARHSAAVAATVALGLGIGLALGLPRDYWIMLTVLVALRPDLATTVAYSMMRILGTVVGATVAFVVTTTTGNLELLAAVVLFAAAGVFSTRAVNYSLYSAFVTVFLIVLLNLTYVAGPLLAVTRVIDTLLGGGLALTVGVAMALAYRARSRWQGGDRRVGAA